MKFAILALLSTAVSATALKAFDDNNACANPHHLDKEAAWACIQDQFPEAEREAEKQHFFKMYETVEKDMDEADEADEEEEDGEESGEDSGEEADEESEGEQEGEALAERMSREDRQLLRRARR